MGLKADLLDAKIKAAFDVGLPPPDVSEGSYAEREAHYSARAIINTIRQANFTVTQLKAPVVVEELRTPEQPVNIELATLLGDKAPMLKTLKKLAGPLGLSKIIDKLENQIEVAVTPLLEGGAKLAGLDLNKNSGGLQSTGYVFIGDDPDSQGGFDVEGEDGQREFTTVKLLDDDARKLL
tara:strand:- start:90 stop:629 length:540 start_codon:yes stop_codon:yes gene_type:complete